MEFSADSFIDKLAASTTMKNYGNVTYVISSKYNCDLF